MLDRIAMRTSFMKHQTGTQLINLPTTIACLIPFSLVAGPLDTWNARISGTTNTLFAVSYANGNFVAVGSSGTILSSTDGVAWTPRSSGTTNFLAGVAYGNGTWVASGGGGTILASANLVS